LDPPLVLRCADHCTALALDPAAVAVEMIGSSAERLFADFAEALQVAVFLTQGDRIRGTVYPSHEQVVNPEIADVTRPLLSPLPVLGPEGLSWELRVNHQGNSLEQAVAQSHLRNLVLSLSVLGLLGLGLWLMLNYTRQRASLAERQMDFVASASHELRTPLSVLASAAENLADGTISHMDRAREYGSLIQSEAGKLTAMIDNVLQFSESTSRPAEMSEIDADGLIRRALLACRSNTQGFDIRIDVEPDLPPFLGDPNGLQSVLVNLIVNAAKYAEGGRWIQVVAQLLPASRRRGVLAISVSNPITSRQDADPENWFEPFRRGRSALQRGIPGTGIGLSVARTVAERHGGGLSVSLDRKQQVRFTLFLPLAD
jgi:signal transduction histidine kinase